MSSVSSCSAAASSPAASAPCSAPSAAPSAGCSADSSPGLVTTWGAGRGQRERRPEAEQEGQVCPVVQRKQTVESKGGEGRGFAGSVSDLEEGCHGPQRRQAHRRGLVLALAPRQAAAQHGRQLGHEGAQRLRQAAHHLRTTQQRAPTKIRGP